MPVLAGGMFTPIRTVQHVYVHRKYSAVSGLVSWLKGSRTSTNKATSYVEFKGTPPSSSVMDCIKLFPEFITKKEHEALVAEVSPKLELRRYEQGHWDNVAKLYREIEIPNWSDASLAIFERVKNVDEIEKAKKWGKYVHVLDVMKQGEIGHHIDNKEAFGCTIAGISLLSESVMTMENKETGTIIELYLPPRSLYVISNEVRYEYGHAIVHTPSFKGKPVHKDRRISLILRTLTTDKDCLHQ